MINSKRFESGYAPMEVSSWHLTGGF